MAGVLINFYKSLKPFESFDVITELKGCDFKWIYMEQRIEVEGQIYARAYIRGLFRNQSGNVSPAKVMEALGRGDESIVNSSVSNLFENITTLKL